MVRKERYRNVFEAQCTIKMKPDHVKLKTNIDCSKEINDSNSKFKRGDIVRI